MFTRSVSMLAICAIAFAQSAKKYKDQAEYDLYNAAATALGANNFSKALADLDAWKQKYPDSDFRDDRQLLYVQAYAGAKQPANALSAAAPLLARGIKASADAVKLLFTTVVAIQQLPDATAEQLAMGGKAAGLLLTYDIKPEGVTDEAWAQARTQLQSAARNALLYVALTPGSQALRRKDCSVAETLLSRAIGAYPESAQAAWLLGSAQLCLYQTIPEKVSASLYEFARAAALDPTKEKLAYLETIYRRYHGDDPEGLRQLRQTAMSSPLPPSGFHIPSASEVARQKEAEFEKSNPQLALWMKVKVALAESNGMQYFESNLKDAAVPQLRGTLVEAKPACRPRELLVAMEGSKPEISLKLDRALSGA